MKIQKTTIRVRYKETDRMGVAYYSNYFVWFEVARTELFRKLGLPYTELEAAGQRLMVVGAECAYKSPVTYDDQITVETRIEDVKNTSLAFSYTIRREDVLVATGKTTHVFTDAKGKPTRIPEKLNEAMA